MAGHGFLTVAFDPPSITRPSTATPPSGNSTDGWNLIGTQSFLNQRLLCYADEIETLVLLIHGEKAHSRHFN